MNRSKAFSLLAASAYSVFMMLGCNAQTVEDDSAAGEEALGELEQGLTVCGWNCPNNYHAVGYGCDSITCGGSCAFGATNMVGCELNSGSFSQCGTACPYGWHPTSYSCSTLYCGGTSCGFGALNQASCAPNSGTFTQCGWTCPSGWHSVGSGCDLFTCGGSSCAFGATNMVTCAPDCDPRAGTHGQMWVIESAESQYTYQGGWCSIGTNWPAMCFQGTYYYSQSVYGQPSCASVGSNGSCYDPDAWWRVKCRSLIDCIYDCSGQCVRADC